MSDFEFLGPYRVEAKLGKGGMGSVYRGVHRETGQRVAIKVLATEMAKEPRFRNRFASEIRTLEKLSHPNIVRLIAWPKDLDDPEARESYQGPLFYSMELVEGPSLLEHLRQVKRLDWDTTIGYAIEICSALKHAHDMGVIHRDLKPANLLLEPEGTIKLTDFGIAKLFGAAEQTAAGSVLGTADYMAPEQASGGKISERTDLYALGSLMYACLAGRPPFGGRNLTRVIHGLKHETPPPLDLVLPDVPPELAELIHELLEKKPEDRPPTALVVGKRLKALRAGLRKRGELTRFDTDSQTLPEGIADKIATNPILQSPRKGSVSDIPTAPEVQLDGITGLGNLKPSSVSEETQDSQFQSNATNAELKLRQVDDDKRSRYETTPDGIETVSRRASAKEETESHNWVSVIGLTVLLLAVISGLAWAFRKPSNEALYERVETAIARNDFRDAQEALKELARAYPSDGRLVELEDQLPSENVDQMLRQIERREKLLTKSKSVSIAELSWARIMKDRTNKPQEAIDQIQSWLAVYGNDQIYASDEVETKAGARNYIKELVLLAKRELVRLEELPKDQKSPELLELESLIAAGLKNLSGQELIDFKQGIKTVYGDQPWAGPALKGLGSENPIEP